MSEIEQSVSIAIGSMAYPDVSWHSKTGYDYTGVEQTEQENLVENAVYETGQSSYLEYASKIFGCCRDYSPAIKLPKIEANRHSVIRSKRVVRSTRPAVRQTFAARKAAKAADSGGGSSDPDGRRPPNQQKPIRFTLPVFAFLFGGAK